MNGAHDLGGMHGFGPVNPEKDEPVFHHEWERRAFAVTLALGALGKWNLDMSRFARENRPPADYLSSTYYELWLKGIERLAVENGLLTADELVSGKVASRTELKPLEKSRVAAVLTGSKGARLDEDVAPRFKAGERVRVKNEHPSWHTRMPRYCRGKAGAIHIDHGVFIFPDTHSQGLGPKPQHCYAVRFEFAELWGRPGRDSVFIDLWDDYLEKA
jgi:nitrile hydratase beta subunit